VFQDVIQYLPRRPVQRAGDVRQFDLREFTVDVAPVCGLSDPGCGFAPASGTAKHYVASRQIKQ
jgi:hypothetical protein